MQTLKKNPWIIGILSLMAIGGTSYFLYKRAKKRSTRSFLPTKSTKSQKILGKQVLPGSEGYVNVRSTPEVDQENWDKLDFSSNLLRKVTSSPVGVVLQQIKGVDGYFWYKIRLHQPIGNKREGYVREDAVTIQT